MALANYADVINNTNPDCSRHGENPEEQTEMFFLSRPQLGQQPMITLRRQAGRRDSLRNN
jgi:hypothetical protein